MSAVQPFLILSIVAMLQACSIGGLVQSRPNNVQFLQRDDPKLEKCRRLGPISSTGSGHYNMETGLSDAANQLRVSAAFLGGDTVVILTREGDDNLYTKIHAVAYRCTIL